MIARALSVAANAFPAWVLLALILGMKRPDLFTWFEPYISPGLAVIMLGMGMTLSADDFLGVLRMPRAVAVGFAAQYAIMPVLGWAAATGVGLERDLAVGVILVGCCPGGTASNVVTYLARANVPLSVLMTLCSTIGAVVMTPLLTWALAGAIVEVDPLGLLKSTALVVVLPLVGGLLLNRYAGRLVALNAERVEESGRPLLLALAILHAGGFGLGWVFAWAFGYREAERRTVAIEVGMQNSGLGAVLAKRHFADPVTGVALAAVPCAISAVMHSVLGSLLAGVWRLFPPAPVTVPEEKTA
jgi:BASS family bile acid:Na+ symporter